MLRSEYFFHASVICSWMKGLFSMPFPESLGVLGFCFLVHGLIRVIASVFNNNWNS